MREGGVLKLARLYTFPRRCTNGRFGAPPVGEIYWVEYTFRRISIQVPAFYQSAEIVSLGFLLFL